MTSASYLRWTAATVLLICLLICLTPSELRAANPSGRWVGTWSSTSTGHQGPLRARIRPVDATTYRALFAGRFAKVVPFVYPAKLQRIPGTYNRYQSSTRLPLLGEYKMNATITPHQFNATFRGKRDAGVFRMSR